MSTLVLPTFLVIGAAKSGSTSLYEYLRAHPDVFMSEMKELDFFTEEHNWSRGVEWYSRQFEGGKGMPARGEASVGYSRDPWHGGVPERIATLLPDARFVYVIREPVARMRSQYLHEYAQRWETRSMEEALLSDDRYLCTSRYAHQIERYLEVFPRDRLLVISSDELRTEREVTMAKVLSFIGVSRAPVAGADVEHNQITQWRRIAPWLPSEWRNTVAYRAGRRLLPAGVRRKIYEVVSEPMDAERLPVADDLRAELVELLRPDLVRLRELLGGEFHCWGHLDA